MTDRPLRPPFALLTVVNFEPSADAMASVTTFVLSPERWSRTVDPACTPTSSYQSAVSQWLIEAVTGTAFVKISAVVVQWLFSISVASVEAISSNSSKRLM